MSLIPWYDDFLRKMQKKNHQKSIFWLFKRDLLLNGSKWPYNRVDLFCREFQALSFDTHVSYNLIWRFFEKNAKKTAKNRFFDFSNATCYLMVENGDMIANNFIVENFMLSHLIPMSFIPWYDDFLRKMPKTVKNWFFDFSNAICHWMAQNGEKFIQTFFVENFTLFRLIPMSFIPWYDNFLRKMQKTVKNRFFDFSNTICCLMVENRNMIVYTFFVENFMLFHLISILYIPKCYGFWEKS